MKLRGVTSFPEALADLRDAERHLDPHRVEDVLVVQEDALGRLGAEVGLGVLVADRADERLEHQVEHPRLGQRARRVRVRPDDLGLHVLVEIRVEMEVVVAGGNQLAAAGLLDELSGLLLEVGLGLVTLHDGKPSEEMLLALALDDDLRTLDVVRPVPLLGLPAVHHRVVEPADVPAGDPRLGVLDDGRIQADDLEGVAVGADGGALDHRAPPVVADVVLELHAEGPVVPEAVDAAVDLAGRVDEPPPFAQRDELFHHVVARFAHGVHLERDRQAVH